MRVLGSGAFVPGATDASDAASRDDEASSRNGTCSSSNGNAAKVSLVRPWRNASRSSSTPNAFGVDSASALARDLSASSASIAWKLRSLCSATATVFAAMSARAFSTVANVTEPWNSSACSCAAAAAREACSCAAVATSEAAADRATTAR